MARSDPAELVRSEAAEAFCTVHYQPAADLLVAMLRNDESWLVRALVADELECSLLVNDFGRFWIRLVMAAARRLGLHSLDIRGVRTFLLIKDYLLTFNKEVSWLSLRSGGGLATWMAVACLGEIVAPAHTRYTCPIH